MANFYPTTESELRTITGYWDDSGGSRVAGTANTVGDIIHLPAATITASGDDKVLSVMPGVHIIGQGATSILSGFAFRLIGTGGATVASAIGKWTLDINGLAATAAGALATHGGAIIQDASCASHQWSVINSTASAGGNNLTITNTTGVDPIECLLNQATITNSDRDCLSTKGGGSGGNTSALIRSFGSTFNTPGAGAADQAASCHEGVNLELYGGTLAGNASGSNLAFVMADDGYESEPALVNVSVSGQVTRCFTIDGCTVDLAADVNIYDVRVVRDTIITNSPNSTLAIGYAIRVVTDLDGTWTPDLLVQRVSDVGTGGGTGVFVPSADYTGDATVVDYVATNKRRGIDLRSSSGHTITDAVLEVTQFVTLNDTPSGITGTRITTDLGTFNGADPGGITVEDPLLAATISDARALVNVGGATQPAATDDWSAAVLAAYDALLPSGGGGKHAWLARHPARRRRKVASNAD